MADGARASVYSIPAHRGFADALATGLIARFGKEVDGLARLTLLVPNQRAGRAITEAFVRQAEQGLLLPRMVAVGDIDLAESLGSALDSIGAGPDIPPAVEGVQRLFALTEIIGETGHLLKGELSPTEKLRLAREVAATIDSLLVEDIPQARLGEIDIADELAHHWQTSLNFFESVHGKWQEKLASLGMIDAADRRNQLLRYAARKWENEPAPYPVIAVGITTAAPAIAALQKTIAFMRQGMVVLPDLDLTLDDDIWDTLEPVEFGPDVPRPAVGVVTHPQYHLKLLLHRMGVNRGEVMRWARSGQSDAPAQRAHVISNIFLPAEESSNWRGLDSRARSVSQLKVIEAANPEEEALAIAIRVREALEVKGDRIAVVTPDRQLAARVSAHLKRWHIDADDSAGQALSVVPEGVLLITLAECISEDFAPVSLLGLFKHPLVQSGDVRATWLRQVRRLDLALRGPRRTGGFAALHQAVAEAKRVLPDEKAREELLAWLDSAEQLMQPAIALRQARDTQLSDYLAALRDTATALCGARIWSGIAGRSAADMLSEIEAEAAQVRLAMEPRHGPAILRSFTDEVAIRPAYGKHPHVAIYGLLEARLQQADLVICGGLNEGSWPQAPDIDPLLSPRIAREIGLAPPELRIGLAAHDLAGAMGAPRVILTRAKREASGPAVASRFFLRLQAMSGARLQADKEALYLARALDRQLPASRMEQPRPMPDAAQRRVDIAVTDLDRLRADPFAFYARKILHLAALDMVDAPPSPAWRGSAVHEILEAWKKEDGLDPARLVARAEALLMSGSANALLRTLWRPRLIAAIRWIAEETARLMAEGRDVRAAEIWGDMTIRGVRISGKVDRIDGLPDGEKLAIIDYKTGSPPSGSQVEAGFALQLGLLGMIAERGGFKDISGEAKAFEYWSLAKNKAGGFGYRDEPVKEGRKRTGLLREEFTQKTEEYLIDAIDRWLLGTEPFTAKLNPDLPSYNDYDQLMRLDEWYGRLVTDEET